MGAALVLIGALAFAGFESWRVASDPDVPWLRDTGGARWILYARPVEPFSRHREETRTEFRVRFRSPAETADPVCELRGLRRASLSLDGHTLLALTPTPEDWRTVRRVDLGPGLAAGHHELVATVANDAGPPALWLRCPGLGIATGPDAWQARAAGAAWSRAGVADDLRISRLSRHYPTTTEAFGRLLPWLALCFALSAGLAWAIGRGALPGALAARATPGTLRVVLLLAWAALSIHNAPRLPQWVGFDVSAHLDYVRFVLEHRAVPFATDGWQMFQSPLYYLVAAALWGASSGWFPDDGLVYAVRAIGLAAGMAQIEICYRVLRDALPQRPDLQAAGLVVGGLLPMNLVVSQYAGNEPLAGVLSAAAFACAVRLLTRSERDGRARTQLWLGTWLGAALLAKVSAVLLIPVAVGAVVWSERAAGGRLRESTPALLRVLIPAAAISSWYYARNWWVLGSPFVGGWDPARGIGWWQDPGYRSPGQLTRFGDSLVHPFLSSFSGFFDAAYSTLFTDGYLSAMVSPEFHPPWHYDWLLAGTLVSTVPMLAILVGPAVACVARGSRLDGAAAPAALATGALALYWAAMLHLFLGLPIFSTVKASYTLGLLPAYALLAALGFAPLARWPVGRIAIAGVLGAYAACALVGFWVA